MISFIYSIYCHNNNTELKELMNKSLLWHLRFLHSRSNKLTCLFHSLEYCDGEGKMEQYLFLRNVWINSKICGMSSCGTMIFIKRFSKTDSDI